jgi:phage shock protein PspC (stress-responsive transcriptional regulator)
MCIGIYIAVVITANRVLGGVLGGIGEMYKIDPNILRISYALFTILTGGVGVLLYVLARVLIPEGGAVTTPQAL